MRLFAGLDLPAEVVANLERLLERLRPTARISWSSPANLHITTKFIGEWPEERLSELQAALGGLPSRAALELRIKGVGFFPNPRAPRTFWCGVESPGLAGLAADTEGAVAAVGVEREAREFNAHLTLARIKERPNLEALGKAVASLTSFEFGRFEARSFFLYRSTLRPTGSVYTKLAEFPLAK